MANSAAMDSALARIRAAAQDFAGAPDDSEFSEAYLACRWACELAIEGSKRIEVRDGILTSQAAENQRLDVFKGADMVQWLEQHIDTVRARLGLPETDDGFSEAEKQGAAKLGMPVAVAVAGMKMMTNKLFLRLERANTKLPPGKKKLPRWPRKFVWSKQQLLTRKQQTTVLFSGKRAGESAQIEDDAYYGFLYVRPLQVKSLVYGALLVVTPFLLCLYPIAPLWFKFCVVYLCMGLLALIFGICLVRWLAYGAVWLATGRSFWVFPNLFNDDVPFMDALLPRYGYDKRAGVAKWYSRLTVIGILAAGGFAFYLNAPDEDAVKDMRDTAGNSFDEFMNWAVSNKALSNGTNATNATEAEEAEEKKKKPRENMTYDEIFAEGLEDILEEGEEGEDLLREEAELSMEERDARLEAMLASEEAEDDAADARAASGADGEL